MADCFSLPSAVELVAETRLSAEYIARLNGGEAKDYFPWKAADAIEQLVSKCNQLAEENEKLKAERDDALKRLAFISAAVGLEVVKEEEDATDRR